MQFFSSSSVLRIFLFFNPWTYKVGGGGGEIECRDSQDMTSPVVGGQANFRGKYISFQLLSTIKVYLVAKIMQSAYLCVIFM